MSKHGKYETIKIEREEGEQAEWKAHKSRFVETPRESKQERTRVPQGASSINRITSLVE
jgi:hypothetical protein